MRSTASIIVKYLLLAVAFFESLAVLYLRWGMPLSSPHAFRETETAIAVYYMLHGGHLMPYQTPVMGPPWTIPFEFPTFQFIVAGVVYATGIDLDNAGRLVSWLFMVACCLPLSRLGRRYGMVDPWICCALFLASPLFLFWGTAFLIETCSLFLCLMFLMLMEERRWVLGACLAVLAAMTKLPTFLPFALLSCVSSWSVWPFAIATFAGGCAFGWNHWTDVLKAASPLSAVLMSSQPRQMAHNFGTLAQRLSWEPWRTIWRSIWQLL